LIVAERRIEMKEVHDEASAATANNGVVDVSGPDAVNVSLKPAAALKTAERISSAAVEALLEQTSQASKERH